MAKRRRLIAPDQNELDKIDEGFAAKPPLGRGVSPPIAQVASEAATLAFYLTTGYMFRPVVDNPYLHLNEDELDLEEIEMRVEEGRSL